MEAAREASNGLEAATRDAASISASVPSRRESGSRDALKRHLLLMQMYARYLLPLSILGSN